MLETKRRQTAKSRDIGWRAAKQIMEEKDTPDWALHLSIKGSFQQRFDELNESINGLKKDKRAILNRVCNAEKRIGAVEDQMAVDCKTLNDLTKDVDSLKTKLTTLVAQRKRNDIVLVGLEEGLEAGDPNKVMNDILRYILDLKDTDTVPEVERHHRSLYVPTWDHLNHLAQLPHADVEVE